ncbi:TPR domain protein [Beauveria brongniartii RCEF 3172]|uniref:TPR domain protein n=1 Tax=Beauveria brongniartii RCEF 3172 TaxID=1081107 RepID=A0A162JYI9_9HYPO|nr:TPR domain protein [Beauveria brongniartii RCEF 3172]
MDTREVSQDAQFAAHVREVGLMHEMAQLRNGQLVHDHPPPDSLVARFSAIRVSLNAKHATQETLISTTQLPPPYPPSDRFVEELSPIDIKQMRLGEHHRGSRVIVRALTSPIRLNAIMLVVEDLEGTAVNLQLHHHPSADDVPSEEVINIGNVLIIKEPFFKCTTDNSYSLRVDHLSDVVWLEPFDSRVPDAWRTAVPEMISETVRVQGNEAVRRKCWAKALRLYSDAARYAVTPEEAQLAFVNRSFVNLKLNRPEQALLDATRMNEQISPTEKAVFREIRALYELAYFDRCLERLRYFTEHYPKNDDAKVEMNRVKARLREKNDGAYSFASMYKQARQSPALIDCATFSEPVEIRESPGRGRGLFTVNAVKAGDLLLCEKAFVYKQCDVNSRRQSVLMDLGQKRGFAGGQAEILTQAVQNLYHNPEYSRPFLQLHRGDYKAVRRQRADGNPIADSFLAARIMSLNVFGSPRTTLEVVIEALKKEKSVRDNDEDGFDTSGIWIKASYVNHSCVGNCHRSFIGDMLILRAAADMEPGTELVFSYRQTKELETYHDVQRSLNNWSFTCDCALCRAKHATPAAQLSRRKLLFKRLQDIVDTQQDIPLAKGVRLLNQIKDTYTASNSAELPRPDLSRLYLSMATEYARQGDPRKCMDLLLRGLSAFGYDIKAVWPTIDSAGSVSSTAQFEIKRWGMADGKVVEALVGLCMASVVMAPSLHRHILRYAQTAYSIAVGEMETFGKAFPMAE